MNNYQISDISNKDIRDIFEDINFEENDFEYNHEELEDDNPKLINKVACPNCNDSEIIEDYSAGIKVCTGCGQVVDNIMDAGPEWRKYDDDTKQENGRYSVPINMLLPQSSLGTSIGGGIRNSRLKLIHSWNSMPYKERSLNIVFKEISQKCQKSNILKCIEDDAKIMYKTINESKHESGKNVGKNIIIRGSNRKGLIASCVFFACKRKGMTRSPKEIAELFDIDTGELSKGCKHFNKLVKIKKIELDTGNTLPEHFVDRFCKDLKIKKEYSNHAFQIAQNIKKLNIASIHTPFSIAITSILLMAEYYKISNISKRKLADKFNVSEVTIVKTMKKIEAYKNILVNNKLTESALENITETVNNKLIPEHLFDKFKRFNIPTSKEQLDKTKIDYEQFFDIINIDTDMNIIIKDKFDFQSYLNKINKKLAIIKN